MQLVIGIVLKANEGRVYEKGKFEVEIGGIYGLCCGYVNGEYFITLGFVTVAYER